MCPTSPLTLGVCPTQLEPYQLSWAGLCHFGPTPCSSRLLRVPRVQLLRVHIVWDALLSAVGRTPASPLNLGCGTTVSHDCWVLWCFGRLPASRHILELRGSFLVLKYPKKLWLCPTRETSPWSSSLAARAATWSQTQQPGGSSFSC